MLADTHGLKRRLALRVVALCGSVALIGSCAATAPVRAPARIDVQEEVGFTITEKARMGGGLRADYQEALTLLEQGHSERGIALLETVVDAAPRLNAPRVDLGVAYHRAGNLDAATRVLSQALESNPSHPVAHNELGIVHRKAGRYEQARQSYQAALRIYPGYHFARRNLAVLCDLYLADFTCALDNYQAYMQTVPGDDEASIWIADLRMRMAKEDK